MNYINLLPDKTIVKCWREISRTSKLAFLSTFVIGFFCHFAGINKWGLFNWDQHFDRSWLPRTWLSQGKWLGGTADIFDVHSPLLAVGIGGFLATFLSVMVIVIYSVEIYFGQVLLCVLSCAITHYWKNIYGWLVGTLLLSLALGIYPPYVSFAACVLLLLIIMEVFRTKSTFVSIFEIGVKSFFQLLGALLLYKGIFQITLKMKGLSPSGYYNMDKAGYITVNRIPEYIARMYRTFWEFFWYDEFGTKDGYIIFAYRLCLILLIVSIIYIVICKKIYKEMYKILILLVCVFLYPIAIDLAALLGDGIKTHWLMKYTFVMLPVAVLIVVDWGLQTMQSKEDLTNASRAFGILQQWTAVLLCVLMIHANCLLSNQGYLRMRLAFERNYAMLINIADDILEYDAYQTELPVAFIGTSQILKSDGLNQFDSVTGVYSNYLFNHAGVLERFESMFVGVPFIYADEKTKKEIENTLEFAEMPIYPYSGYISIIDGVLTAKF